MIEELELGEAADLLAVRTALAQMAPAGSETQALDRVRALEELKAACAAAQARDTVAFDRHRRREEIARGVPARQQGQGVAAEIALARRESPARGARHLELARALLHEMPRTLTALTAGTASEEKATIICQETAWLPGDARRQVDEALADRLAQAGTRRLGAEARAHAQRLDEAAAAEHLGRRIEERRVSMRPAPEGMAYLTALLPKPQAVTAYLSLYRDAASAVSTGDAAGRTQQQMMSDLLVERVTGQSDVAAIPVELHVVMAQDTLLGGGSTPAWIPGHGPLPAPTARRLIAETEAEVFVRRLFTAPDSGQLVAMESRNREFPRLLRRMVIFRDDMCRTPWCDAPIRHIDHAAPHHQGGTTSYANASGLCARCNYMKERTGWRHYATAAQLRVATPTGHTYTTTTPPLVVGGSPPGKAPRPGAPPGDEDPP